MRESSARKVSGFTIIELLVVMAIIAILYTMLTPVIRAVKASAYQSVASRGIAQLQMASTLYLIDHDDMYPQAMYLTREGRLMTWFGEYIGNEEFDLKNGILSAYRGDTILKDRTHIARRYLGDMSGFGYNWGFIGSDFHISQNYSRWPVCTGMASSSQLENPSSTVIFATSSFYFASWLKDGDDVTYDFGFVDPPDFWYGNPNVDFRHMGRRNPDPETQEVHSDGRAIFVFADGSVKTMTEEMVKPEHFRRETDAR